jgi:uncharacterized membrane protein YoaK (UPF0700 family)
MFRIRDLRVSGWLCGLAVIAFVAVIATNLLDLGVYDLGVRMLDANWEHSWSHDLDTLALAVGVVVTAVGARRDRRQRALWVATSVILALLFLDEASPLHAEIGHISKLLYAPVLCALVICLWRLSNGTPEWSTAVLGLAMLFISFAMHVVGLTLLRPLGYLSWPYQFGVGIKEGAALAGWLLVTFALWKLARSPRPQWSARRTVPAR